MKDKEVREKLESLNPLSGGIVFGKEEAWDKLQARLDKPAPKKVIAWYRWAAAAALLVCISIVGFYLYPEKQVAINQPLNPAIITDTEQQVVSTQPVTDPLITTPETLVIQNSEQRNPRKKNDVPQTKFVVKEEPKEVPESSEAGAIPPPAIVANTPPKPVVPPIKKMRVVHINELGKITETENAAIAYSGPTLDISKMKVVSLYDLQREESLHKQEEEIATLVRINRPHGSLFTFPGQFNRNNPYDRSLAQNPLSIKLHKNN